MRTTGSPRTMGERGDCEENPDDEPCGGWSALRVVADGQDGPAPVATNEVDREWIRQPLDDAAHPDRHASAARVDPLETCTNGLGPAGPGCRRRAEPLERRAQFLGGAR